MRSPSEVRSSVSLRHAVAAVLALSAMSMQFMHSAAAQEAKEDVANLSDVNVADDPFRQLSTDPSASSFGFAKPLLETPRTVTFVSEEQLRLFGVSTVEDLSRLVPGTYSTTRYGLQGGINVRGVSADFYYRGMKRLNMQGHVRTVLSAYDNIEVIKGPPSPLYGLGKIGGYANLEPKSNRARTGKYKTGMDGYFQETLGNYKKNEMQFGVGMPFKIGERSGGAYVVGLLEDSGTFVRSVEAHQKFIQGTASLDNVIGPFRLETGGQAQNSITTGAYFTRVTKELIQNDQYIAGSPMVNLDLNGDGRVGYVETYLASPVSGGISASNSALSQRYTLPVTNGVPLDVRTLKNTITGVPQTFINYLNAHPEIQCAAASALVAAGGVTATGNPLFISTTRANAIPVGFALNPCTVQTKTLAQANYRANGAYERQQNATQRMFYFDLINDRDPNFTMKNQFFYDSLISFKDSFLPYGENQSIRAVEDKFTMTKKLSADMLPDWLAVNTLGSANFRQTSGYIKSSGGDFDFRQDISQEAQLGAYGTGNNSFLPTNMFWTQLTNDDYGTGAVDTAWRKSKFTESGIGLMADIDIFRNTNLLLGTRIDSITAQSREFASFNATTGNVVLLTNPSPATNGLSNLEYTQQEYAKGRYCATWAPGCPGAYMQPGPKVKDSQSGKSWSVSLSHKLPWFGLVPYVTKASTTLTLDTANNLYTASTIATNTTGVNVGAAPAAAPVYTSKILGNATLLEAGIKGQVLRGKLQWTLAGFQQERVDVAAPSDPSAGAEVSSTVTKGVEVSMNYAATKKLFVGVSGVWSDARYAVGASGTNIDVNARDLGFQDIKDANGNVLIPAEALLYGGRVAATLNDPNNVYDVVPGSPKWQGALNSTYQLGKGFTLLANAQYTSWSWGSRLQTLKIPESTTINIGATWDSARIHLKGNIYNLMDDIAFRGTNGSGNRNMASVLPDRRYEASLKLDF